MAGVGVFSSLLQLLLVVIALGHLVEIVAGSDNDAEERLELAYLDLYNKGLLRQPHLDFAILSHLLTNPQHEQGVQKAGLQHFAALLANKTPQQLERMTNAWKSGNAGRMLKVLGDQELVIFTTVMERFNSWVGEKRRGWAVVNRHTGEVGKRGGGLSWLLL